MLGDGWIKLKRSKATEELLNDRNAWTLLSLVAYRARRTNDFNINNLYPGEALIGDYKKCGLKTRQEYRETLKRLIDWKFITIRTTNKGTIVKLINSNIFDINIEDNNHQNNHQTTIKKQINNHQTTIKQPSKQPSKQPTNNQQNKHVTTNKQLSNNQQNNQTTTRQQPSKSKLTTTNKNEKNKNEKNKKNVWNIPSLPKKDLARSTHYPKLGVNSEVETFFTLARESYLEKFKNPLIISNGREGAGIKKTLKTINLEKLKKLWLMFLEMDDDFVNKKGRSISIFLCCINQLNSGNPKESSDSCYHDEGKPIPQTCEQQQAEKKENVLKLEYSRYLKEETKKRIKSLPSEQYKRELGEFKKEYLKRYRRASTWDDETLRENIEAGYEMKVSEQLKQLIPFEDWIKRTCL